MPFNFMNKDFYEQHFDNCDYCFEVHDSDRTDAEKDKLINNHIENDYAWKVDNAYSQWKDREVV